MTKSILLAALCSVSLSCTAKVQFTRQAMNELQITKENAGRYQFYTTHALKMQAIENKLETKVIDGSVKASGLTEINRVVVPRDTEVTISAIAGDVVLVTAGEGSKFLFQPVAAGVEIQIIEEDDSIGGRLASFFGRDVETTSRRIKVGEEGNGWYCLVTYNQIPYESRDYTPLGTTCLNYALSKDVRQSTTRKVLGGSKAK